MAHLRVNPLSCFSFLIFHFFIFLFSGKCISSSSEFISLPALVSEFNYRCFCFSFFPCRFSEKKLG